MGRRQHGAKLYRVEVSRKEYGSVDVRANCKDEARDKYNDSESENIDWYRSGETEIDEIEERDE